MTLTWWPLTYISGYVVQGSNGEYTMLDTEERVEMVRRVKQMAAPDRLIIAGSGCECKYMTFWPLVTS